MPRDPSSRSSDDHYSYAAYADPSMAATFDAKRFGGPIGRMLLEDQEKVLRDFLGDVAGREILDMATGTGRAALALATQGAVVTGLDASVEMLKVARQRAAAAGLAISFGEGDVLDLPFPDRRFDAVVCLRLLMHVPDWRRALSELCRVSRRQLVFDYPALGSTAAAQALWRRAAHAAGRDVEAYRVFRAGEIARQLDRCGFRVVRSHRQFVLPIALHKAVGSRAMTRGVERALAGAGLLRLAGSPVTVLAEPCAS